MSNKFQIVQEQFPIHTDGIIGRDLLEKFLCKIDFATYTITFNINYHGIIIPIDTNPLKINELSTFARPESIVAINLTRNEDNIILSKEGKVSS